VIVVPYVEGRLHPATAAAARAAGGVPWRLDPADDTAYALLLSCLWSSGEGFTVLEEDVEPPPRWTAAFDACPSGWCCRSPRLRPGLAWLGCVRFRPEFCAEHPTAMVEAMSIEDDGAPAWTWRKVDVRLERVLRGRHLTPCFHDPPCRHLSRE
jgi:hypothetical protein